MLKDLQIIKELENKFGEFSYELDSNEEVVELGISSEGVETKDLELIGELTSLEWLDLYGNKLTEIQGLDKLTKLQRLWLGSNQITEIKGLDSLNSLTWLGLSDNNITEMKGLDNLKSLGCLYLSKNKISKIQGLDELTNLRELDLSYNKIFCLEGLDNLLSWKILFFRLIKTKLNKLKIKGNYGIAERQIRNFQLKNPEILIYH